MTPKFTKGEWQLPHFVTRKSEKDCACGFVLNESIETSVCTINCNQDKEEPQIPLEQVKANAFLICASKDIYFALEHLIQLKDWKDKHGKDEHYLKAQPIAWDNARKALKKANGNI
jgi:hypothetical protein